jgi:hypothetical protein
MAADPGSGYVGALLTSAAVRRSATRPSYALCRASASGARNTADGWIVATSNPCQSATSMSSGLPRTSMRRALVGPSPKTEAVAFWYRSHLVQPAVSAASWASFVTRSGYPPRSASHRAARVTSAHLGRGARYRLAERRAAECDWTRRTLAATSRPWAPTAPGGDSTGITSCGTTAGSGTSTTACCSSAPSYRPSAW